MTHDEKVNYLINDLAKRGVSAATTAPPTWRAAWKLGLHIPPPHFMGFLPLAIINGVVVGALMGAAMRFLIWGHQGLWSSVFVGAGVGIMFGLATAASYRTSAKRLRLPAWEHYPES